VLENQTKVTKNKSCSAPYLAVADIICRNIISSSSSLDSVTDLLNTEPGPALQRMEGVRSLGHMVARGDMDLINFPVFASEPQRHNKCTKILGGAKLLTRGNERKKGATATTPSQPIALEKGKHSNTQPIIKLMRASYLFIGVMGIEVVPLLLSSSTKRILSPERFLSSSRKSKTICIWCEFPASTINAGSRKSFYRYLAGTW
jgi:hypothetical protein